MHFQIDGLPGKTEVSISSILKTLTQGNEDVFETYV